MKYILKDFGKQLKRNHLEFRRYFSPKGTDCYRVYDSNITGIPATVDIYDEFVYITDYRDGNPLMETGVSELLDTASRMLYFSRERIIYKTRSAREGRKQHEKLSGTGTMMEVHENGLTFLVNLEDYIDTGLFLDHRRTREMVMELSAGKKVLNLFAYTGSFSVYAAAGGAAEVDTVDLSGKYLTWAQHNFQRNNLDRENHLFHTSDAAEYLKTARNTGRKYNIIILDPPTFSNSRKMDGTFDIQRDYVSMINSCIPLLTRDGLIFFSTNYKKFHFDPGRLRGLKSKDITALTIDVDFSKKRKPHRCWVLERR